MPRQNDQVGGEGTMKRVLVTLGIILLAVAGYFAVGATAWLAGHEGRAAGYAVTKHGTSTMLVTTTLAGGRVVRLRRVVHYKPIYRREVTTVNGKRVIVRKVIGRKAVTVTRVVTRTRTNTVVRSHTVTGPGRTIVVTSTRTETQIEPTTVTTTTTVPAVTVTVPITVTVP